MKVSRLVLLVFVACVAGAVSAQTFSLSGPRWVKFAEGEGVLRNHDDVEARFAFAVRMAGDHPAEGRFRFGAHMPHHGTVHIVSEHINRLRVEKHEAWFGGPAVMEVSRPDGTHRFEGRLTVHVRDNVTVGRGRHKRTVDLMEVLFQPAHADWHFDFGGWATHDSIRVGRRKGD